MLSHMEFCRLAAEEQALLVLSDEGSIVFANTRAHALFGYPPEELTGQPVERILPAGTGDDGWARLLRDAASRTPVVNGGLTGVRLDGERLPLDVGLSVTSGGEVRYVVASVVDVTGRRGVEAAPQEHPGFQRLIADIATRFVGVAPEAVDTLVVDSLHEVVEALQLDRGIVWRMGESESDAAAVHRWVRPGFPPPPDPFRTISVPWLMSRLEAGEAAWFSTPEDIPDPVDRQTLGRLGLRSGAVVPLQLEGEESLGALALSSLSREQPWPPAIIDRVRTLAAVIGQALSRKASVVALQHAHAEVRRLRDRLAEENAHFRREVKIVQSACQIVSESEVVKRAIAQVEQVAPTPATVLLLGETGSGKEVFARAIHDMSPRRERHMVRVSCAAIPSALIESELFGRERGAYTGALSRQIGRFEAANHSTLFLDEVGELPAEVQVKLLRVLQERVIERLGSTQSIKVDVRIIAATNRNLEEAVENKTFRDDLYYRLNVFPIVVPPLRERVEDIPGLVWMFIDEFSRSFGKTIESISRESMQDLQQYAWPGNVRELQNIIERAIIVATGPQLVVPAPRPAGRPMVQAAHETHDARGPRSRAHPHHPRDHEAGASAGWVAQPSAWASSRRRSRAAWRAWALRAGRPRDPGGAALMIQLSPRG